MSAEELARSRQERGEPSAAVRVLDLGLGPDGWRRFARYPNADSSADEKARHSSAVFRPPPASATFGLQEGLEAHDRNLGLGASGRALCALYHAAHDAIAPIEGVAHFCITVLKSGSVEVALVDATDQLPAWRAVAEIAAEDLRHSLPRIPTARQGVRLVLEIAAEERYPSGLKAAQLHGPRVEAKLPRFRSVQAAQNALRDQNPLAGQTGEPLAGTKANVDLPGLYVAARGKVCGYRVGITPLGPLLQGGCDLSNWGAKPERLVRTRVRDETPF